MPKKKKRQTSIYKAQHRKIVVRQEPQEKQCVISGSPQVKANTAQIWHLSYCSCENTRHDQSCSVGHTFGKEKLFL